MFYISMLRFLFINQVSIFTSSIKSRVQCKIFRFPNCRPVWRCNGQPVRWSTSWPVRTVHVGLASYLETIRTRDKISDVPSWPASLVLYRPTSPVFYTQNFHDLLISVFCVGLHVPNVPTYNMNSVCYESCMFYSYLHDFFICSV
jgi:hypothetical protein